MDFDLLIFNFFSFLFLKFFFKLLLFVVEDLFLNFFNFKNIYCNVFVMFFFFFIGKCLVILVKRMMVCLYFVSIEVFFLFVFFNVDRYDFLLCLLCVVMLFESGCVIRFVFFMCLGVVLREVIVVRKIIKVNII